MLNYFKYFLMGVAVGLIALPISVLAEVTAGQPVIAGQSTNASVAKVVLGLSVVLIVISITAWLMKKFVQVKGNRKSVIHIVGGVSVGHRERVVVLEVSGRWIVVGVSAGQVNAIANLEMGENDLLHSALTAQPVSHTAFSAMQMQPALHRMANHTFASWLKKSLDKTIA